MNTLIIGYLN